MPRRSAYFAPANEVVFKVVDGILAHCTDFLTRWQTAELSCDLSHFKLEDFLANSIFLFAKSFDAAVFDIWNIRSFSERIFVTLNHFMAFLSQLVVLRRKLHPYEAPSHLVSDKSRRSRPVEAIQY